MRGTRSPHLHGATSAPIGSQPLRAQSPEELARQLCDLRIELLRERRRSARLEALAERDFLTGIANRRGFIKILRQALCHVRRYGNPTCLACFDLNGFKAINDRLGHNRGDELLRQVALKLVEQTRASDAVGRLGGDEFAIVFQNSCPGDIEQRASALEREIARIGRECGGSELSIAAGVTELRSTDDVAEAIDRADRLMYHSKARSIRLVSG